MSPVGAIFVPFPPKTGTNMLHRRPPPIVELVVCSAQHFAMLLLACYPSTMNEVQRNDRSRNFFWSVLQVDSHCLPVQAAHIQKGTNGAARGAEVVDPEGGTRQTKPGLEHENSLKTQRGTSTGRWNKGQKTQP